ncbi:MAG TPA: amino acid ABC transporter ATP-binding protein [Mesotoga infera]|jgi:polar amino acid transport system ATP-binding protein|nr:amino acid ABC transporter ATP-binding protein [Mesotoga sp.]NLI05757.1 amino acid ABC transporter ATP-binding protein [Thermotogaceae bacterium]HNS66989.1 amino acid ABC transporter ATP-binding protein [Mesotoga infera]HOI35063.1 amino acid ABC transporter ATP-binding protein [Mesotoga infera]HON27326.1 amino acid ABC transporter ATP-binding protein [Mesotoga infera]
MTENKILSVRGISKSFDSLSVLKGVSFDVKQGDVIAILGPSGAGKTTLLRCINHLITPDDGDILFKGSTVKSDRKSIRFFRAKVGFVFQRFNLVSHLRVIDNVALPLVKVLGKKWREAREIALKQLSQVGLEDKAASFPSQLSGGQQQRVGIARALVMQPDIVLLDEPTSALDPSLVGEVMRVIKRLSSEGRTMVIVTHEIDFARNIATRVLFMKGGSILKDTNPQEFFESASSEIRDFLTDLSSIV